MEEKRAELTREEKREERFKRWFSPPGVTFSSPEAERAYKERVTRLANALLLKEPDRVPVMLPAANFAAYYAGGTLHKVMYDYDELSRAWTKYLHDFASDMDTFEGPGLVYSGRALEALDYKLYKWPGHGMEPSVSAYQFVEGEYMKADEYDDLIRDPSDFAMRIYLPRTVGALEPFQKFPPLSAALGIPIRFLATVQMPDVQAALQTLIDAGKEMAKWQKAIITCGREALAAGFPSLRGRMCTAPFDSIGDGLRGTQGIMLDMYRQPDKLMEAMEKIADLAIHRTISEVNESGSFMVGFPLHKGDDTFMSDRQFETFYWPTLKKIILALIDEGIMVMLFAEGKYNRRLEVIKDLPRGWVMWQFDQTDMARAKAILGDTSCIAGNVPTSLLVTGTPQAVKECCRQLIEACGPGGGYILTGGASTTEVNADNLKAIMAAAKEYGMYK